MGSSSKFDGHAIQICERKIISHLLRLLTLMSGISLAQLPEVVATPTLDTTIGNQSTGVIRTCNDLSRSEIGTQVGKCQRFTHVIRLVSLLRGIPLTQLPIVIVAPTFDQTLDRNCAVVICSCRNLSRSEESNFQVTGGYLWCDFIG